MRMQLEDRVICCTQDGHCMAVGSMNPLHIVNWRQDGTSDCRFALADFDAKAPKDDKTLCGLSKQTARFKEC